MDIWIMFTGSGWFPIQPSGNCTPEDHGTLNLDVLRIEDIKGNVLWVRGLNCD